MREQRLVRKELGCLGGIARGLVWHKLVSKRDLGGSKGGRLSGLGHTYML